MVFKTSKLSISASSSIEEKKRYLKIFFEDYVKAVNVRKSRFKYRRPKKFLRGNFFEWYDDVFIKYFTNKSVMDIGCCIGWFSVWISLYARRVLGTDISYLASLSLAQEITKLENIEFMYKDAYEMTEDFIKKEKVDSLFLHNILGKTKKKDQVNSHNILGKTKKKNQIDFFWKTILPISSINTIITTHPPTIKSELVKELGWDVSLLEEGRKLYNVRLYLIRRN